MTKEIKSDKKVARPQNRHLIPVKKGEVRNPYGRPKGARSQFSEAFCHDMLKQWQEGGVEVMERVRKEDPSTFLRVAASLLPKEFKLNEGESSLERILENYTSKELDQLIAGLCALGVAEGSKETADEAAASQQSDIVH